MKLRIPLLIGILLSAAGQVPAQPANLYLQPAMFKALVDVRVEFDLLQKQHPGDQLLLDSLNRALVPLTWLRSEAARWKPTRNDEGREMLESIRSLAAAIRKVPSGNLHLFMEQVAADLKAKRDFCKEFGLAATQEVIVVVKSDEGKGVSNREVVYLSRFSESLKPNPKPKQFRDYSNPEARNKIAPGNYSFWARDPKHTAKSGPRKQATIAIGLPGGPIEVLAP